LPSGVYFVKVKTEKGTAVEKFVEEWWEGSIEWWVLSSRSIVWAQSKTDLLHIINFWIVFK
jgi:hypothetical protein